MRKIKFRTWFKSKNHFAIEYNKQMVYGLENTHMFEFIGFHDESVVWMQFTGLKDRNGKEIYEGDISTLESNGMYVCKWSKLYTAFMWENTEMGNVEEKRQWEPVPNMIYFVGSIKEAEVLGNIYENPELIKL